MTKSNLYDAEALLSRLSRIYLPEGDFGTILSNLPATAQTDGLLLEVAYVIIYITFLPRLDLLAILIVSEHQ